MQLYGKELYKRIEHVAKERGFPDVTALCKESGASRGSIGNLNNGLSFSLSAKTISKLCNTLGVSASYLTEMAQDDYYLEVSQGVVEGIKKDPTSISTDEVLAEELINRLCLLTDEELAKVDAFVQGLLASR